MINFTSIIDLLHRNINCDDRQVNPAIGTDLSQLTRAKDGHPNRERTARISVTPPPAP
jgi:hypothetical protein